MYISGPRLKFYNPTYIFQAWACTSAFAAAMAIGASAGFSGVTIPQFQKGHSGNYFQLTEDQLSWFASLPTFATIPTCIFGGKQNSLIG